MNQLAGTATVAASVFAAAAEAILATFEQAPVLSRREQFGFGQLTVDVEVREPENGDLAERLLHRIMHARASPLDAAAPTVTIRAVNTGGRLPEAIADLAATLPRDVEYVHLAVGASMRAVWQPGCGALDMMNLETGEALCCLVWPDRIPGWLLSAPFRHLLNWASLTLPVFEAHGAGIHRDGIGLLLIGASGAGKSTLTAWCVDAGFDSVGDDAVLVERTDRRPPRGYALFDNLKVGADMRAKLPFADRLDWLDANARDKSMATISQIRPGALATSIPVSALVVPRVSGRRETRIANSNSNAAIRALGPSTLHQFKGGERHTLPKIAALCRSVPVFEMETGADRAGAVASLQNLCRELGS